MTTTLRSGIANDGYLQVNAIDILSLTTSGAAAVTGKTLEATSGPNGSAFGFRNKIINGNFDVWQRGTSGFTNPGYSADRWYSNTTNVTASQTALVGIGGVYAMRYITTNATNAAYLEQAIERQVARQLRGKTVTLSGYAVCSSGTVAAQLYLSKNSTPDTRSGGSWSQMDVASPKNITITTTPTQFSVSCVVPNDGTAGGILAGFYFTNAANGVTVDFYGVQLEAGSVATPFETRPIGTELALCQRYYEKSFQQGTAPATNVGLGTGESRCMARTAGATASAMIFSISFIVTKRVSPTQISLYNPAAANNQARDTSIAADCSATTTAYVNATNFAVTATGNAGTAAVTVIGNIHWTAEAEL